MLTEAKEDHECFVSGYIGLSDGNQNLMDLST